MSQAPSRVCLQRRQSVLPTTTPNSNIDVAHCHQRYRNNSFDRVVYNTAHSTASSSVSQTLRRMSNLLKSQGPTEVLKTALGHQNRIRFLELCSQYESLAADWKRTSNFLNSLTPEYMASKGLDPFRRYKKLQSLAKRIVFHLKLTNSGLLLVYPQSFSERDAENIGSALQSSVKQKVMKQRHETICDAYSSEELAGEIRKLDRINCELEEKIHALVEAINNLDDDYQCSKHDVILRRYLLLKCNLKLIFENENLR